MGCFISNCCAKDDDDEDDEGCPIVVHCFPPPIDPNKDDELDVNDDGIVETPPLLLTCKYDDGVEDDDELAALAKCRKDIVLKNNKNRRKVFLF